MIIQYDRTLQSVDIQQEFNMTPCQANTFLRKFGTKMNNAKNSRWVISQRKLAIMKLNGTVMEYMKQIGRTSVYDEQVAEGKD